MGKEVVLFSSEERTDVRRVSDFLHQLADRVLENQVVLRQGEQEVTVAIPNNLVLEIKFEEEAKGEKTQQSLEVELEWIEGEEAGGPVTLG